MSGAVPLWFDAPVTEPATIETFRAAVDALFPTGGEHPGALELNAHEHIIELVELGLPEGFTDLIASLLDAYAQGVRPDSRFSELDPAERVAVLRTMAAEPDPDTSDAANIFWIFSLGAMYSEWTGTVSGGRPAMWDELGYPGPVLGHPDHRRGT